MLSNRARGGSSPSADVNNTCLGLLRLRMKPALQIHSPSRASRGNAAREPFGIAPTLSKPPALALRRRSTPASTAPLAEKSTSSGARSACRPRTHRPAAFSLHRTSHDSNRPRTRTVEAWPTDDNHARRQPPATDNADPSCARR